MKRIAAALALVLMVFLADFLLGHLLRHFYFLEKSGDNYRMIQSIEHTTADVLIFGSSRATRHYNPAILGDSLNMTCYNTGKDGQDMLYCTAIQKCILSRYTPRLVILDIRRGEFRKYTYDRLSVLLPFYRDYPQLEPYIRLMGPFEKIKLLSSVYPFNSAFLAILITNTSYNASNRQDDRGFIPLHREWDKPLSLAPSIVTTGNPLDSARINAFRSFVNECNRKNIPLAVVCSPYYSLPANPDSSLILAKEICSEHHVLFLDLSQEQKYLDHPEWFQDIQHLNSHGASVFSTEILEAIRNHLPRFSIGH